MKLSYNYLKSWVNFTETPAQLADLINLHITEVEALTTSGRFANFVVGEILEIHPHPNADKLQLTKVDVGTEILDIVCGAKNITVGQKVPVALVGAVVAGGLVIKPTAIRGEQSNGMLCSQTELGLAESAEGIMILNEDAPIGTPLGDFLGEAGDSSIELKVLSNRPDYLSYLTIAREIAAVLGRDFNPELELDFDEVGEQLADHLQVEVKERQLCPRYMARVIKNITVKDSPAWIQQVLLASGLRPINNIVDISNFVMLELGQPVHAFDLAHLTDKKIVVRSANKGETILGLDGITHELNENMLVIADAKQPVAIAGIMGGEASGVTSQTVDITLEVANFDRISIRKTARALGLHTDASVRFEKGLSALSPALAMQRLVSLISQDCPEAEVLAGEIDVHETLPEAATILEVAPEAINRLLGIEIEVGEMIEILNRLDLPTVVTANRLAISIPQYRHDIVGVPDIAEEVVRIYGTDRVEEKMPQVQLAPVLVSSLDITSLRVKELLARMGFVEVYLHPFTANKTQAVALENPLSQNATHLKTDLAENLTQATFMERGERVREVKAFELNTIFELTPQVLPEQTQQLVMRVQGEDAYRRVRGAGEILLKTLGINVKYSEIAGLRGVRVMLDKELVGEIGEKSASNAYFSLNITKIVTHLPKSKTYLEPSKFPSVKFDMTFVVSQNIAAGEMLADILSSDILVDTAELVDQFPTAENKRKLTFHIELRSTVKTLTKEDRETVYEIIKNTLHERHHAIVDEG